MTENSLHCSIYCGRSLLQAGTSKLAHVTVTREISHRIESTTEVYMSYNITHQVRVCVCVCVWARRVCVCV